MAWLKVYRDVPDQLVTTVQAGVDHLETVDFEPSALVSVSPEVMLVMYSRRRGLAASLFASLASIVFGFAGWHLVNLSSVSGDSVAEFFYHGVGFMSWALALASAALAAHLLPPARGKPSGL